LFGCFFGHYNHHFLGANPKDSSWSGTSPVDERTGSHFVCVGLTLTVEFDQRRCLFAGSDLVGSLAEA
jgi:hypothetical protein